MAKEPLTLPPQAARTIQGLRDTGYEAADALEDIIDNSIAAGATRVVVRVWLEPDGSPVVTIADNGTGMSADELVNAMTYGAAARPSQASLGKFGLGLKTASTAMCRQLTVVARTDSNAEVNAATWDLDFVETQNDWLLQRPDPTGEQVELLEEAAEGQSGTLVMWRKVDRLIRDYVDPAGKWAQQALQRRIDQFQESLALTYLRYLRGDPPYTQVTIELNDEAIQPWDPFDASLGAEELVRKSPKVTLYNQDGSTSEAEFSLVAYALPPRSELTKEQQQAAQITTRNQGFYVFREGRLLARGTWLGIRSVEPHLNLCRIDFSFDHRLDDAFQIDIKKSRIHLHHDLEQGIAQIISSAVQEAQTRYRKNQRSRANAKSLDIHGASNTIIAKSKESLVSTTVDPVGPDSAAVTNSRGTTRIDVQILDDSVPGGPHVLTRESLDDGLLWEPAIAHSQHAVLLNSGHEFYQRVYLPNVGNGTAIQGMNFLFWSLCVAEWEVLTEEEKMHMEAVRRIVSRATRKLAYELPDVEPDED